MRKITQRLKRRALRLIDIQRDSKNRKIGKMPDPPYLNRHKGQDFLVLGTGPSLKTHLQALKSFSQRRNLITVGVNNTYELVDSDYVGFTNRYRFAQFGPRIQTGARSALLSIHFTDEAIARNCSVPYELVSWHRITEAKDCSIEKQGVISHYGSVSSLMIMVAYVMGAENIFIAGMDGQPSQGTANLESLHFRNYSYKEQFSEDEMAKRYAYWMEDIAPIAYQAIQNWARDSGRREFVSLTPTGYGDFFDSELLNINNDCSEESREPGVETR